MARKLTEKQAAWVDYFKQGHTPTEAARLAGYQAKSDDSFQSIGSENFRKLADYIQDREQILEQPRIANMQEINAFWTAIIRNKHEKTTDRLKASELRAKVAGAFVDQVKHSGEVSVRHSGEVDLSGLTLEELRRLAAAGGEADGENGV